MPGEGNTTVSPVDMDLSPRWMAAESSLFPLPVACQSVLAFQVRAQAGRERQITRNARLVFRAYFLTRFVRLLVSSPQPAHLPRCGIPPLWTYRLSNLRLLRPAPQRERAPVARRHKPNPSPGTSDQ